MTSSGLQIDFCKQAKHIRGPPKKFYTSLRSSNMLWQIWNYIWDNNIELNWQPSNWLHWKSRQPINHTRGPRKFFRGKLIYIISPTFLNLYHTENGIGNRSAQEHLENPKTSRISSLYLEVSIFAKTSVADPGSGAFLIPGSGFDKKSGSGSGSAIYNPDYISWSLETIFWVKILKFFAEDQGSGMEKIRIWDPG